MKAPIGSEVKMTLSAAGEDNHETNLVELVNEVEAFIRAYPTSFMLAEPATLTVKTKNGNYSKRPHIGGEDFRATGCYLGKRGALIFVFKPIFVSDYDLMEMSEQDTVKKLAGFQEYIKQACAGGYDAVVKESKKAAAVEHEREKNANKFEEYADLGFGTW
jgi:hypothetical protein